MKISRDELKLIHEMANNMNTQDTIRFLIAKFGVEVEPPQPKFPEWTIPYTMVENEELTPNMLLRKHAPGLAMDAYEVVIEIEKWPSIVTKETAQLKRRLELVGVKFEV